MSVRLAILAAALVACSGSAQACECRAPAHHRPVVVHRVAEDCHCRVYHHLSLRHVRRARILERPVRYARREDWNYGGYHYAQSDFTHWSSSEQGDGWADRQTYSYQSDAHLSATDRYGYLTWPGKFALDPEPEDAGPDDAANDCADQCGAPPPPYGPSPYGARPYAAPSYDNGQPRYDQPRNERDSYYGQPRYGAPQGVQPSYGQTQPRYDDQSQYDQPGYDQRRP